MQKADRTLAHLVFPAHKAHAEKPKEPNFYTPLIG